MTGAVSKAAKGWVSWCLFLPFPSSPDRIVLVLEPPHPWEPALEGQALVSSRPPCGLALVPWYVLVSS